MLLAGSDSAVTFNQLRIEDLRMGLAALDASERHLAELTAATGGRLYKPATFADLERTYAEVAEELRQQYTLYYSPTKYQARWPVSARPGRDDQRRPPGVSQDWLLRAQRSSPSARPKCYATAQLPAPPCAFLTHQANAIRLCPASDFTC